MAGALRQPALAWLLAASVAATVLNHVPYELYQPYLSLLLGAPGEGWSPTPAAAGALSAVALAVGSAASRRAPALAERAGTSRAILACLGLQGLVIAAMAAALHPAVLLLVALRSVPGAVGKPLLTAAAHPLVADG